MRCATSCPKRGSPKQQGLRCWVAQEISLCGAILWVRVLYVQKNWPCGTIKGPMNCELFSVLHVMVVLSLGGFVQKELAKQIGPAGQLKDQ